MVATTAKSRKAKSRNLQNKVAADIQNLLQMDGTDVKPRTMGEGGIDILLSSRAREQFPFGVECKNQEKISIWSSMEQCTINAEKEGLVPLLIFKRNRVEPYVMLRWSDFLKLL